MNIWIFRKGKIFSAWETLLNEWVHSMISLPLQNVNQFSNDSFKKHFITILQTPCTAVQEVILSVCSISKSEKRT